MEFMGLATFIQYGTPALLLALVILMVWVLQSQTEMRKDIEDIKRGITWGDTCTERHQALNKRLDRLEDRVGELEKK